MRCACARRHSTEIANLTAGFEALQADLRAAENRLETLRAEHFKAGDALHERQGAFYAANAEVTRLEQQLQFARESEGRLSQQVAQITEQIGAFTAQLGAIASDVQAGEREVEAALARREAAGEEERAAAAALPALEAAVADASRALAEIQQHETEIEQSIQLAATRRESAAKLLTALAQRRERLDAETRELAAPVSDQIALVTDQLAQESADLAGREESLAALNAVVQALQEAHRAAGDEWQTTSSGLAEREARAQALQALQAKIGSGKDASAWLASHGLDHARRLWQQIDIEPGWEDALEGVLRERLNALELPALDAAAGWTAGGVALPGRIAAYAPGGAGRGGGGESDALLAKVKGAGAGLDRVLGDWLAGMRCRPDLAAALRDRGSLSVGEAFVTPEGHVVTAQSVGFFAPDSDLHGVLARQRELAELDHAIRAARAATAAAASVRETAENELKTRQQEYHGESMALSSQQRRCHDLELELLQLKQVAEAAERRRAQIADELAALAVEERTEHDAMVAIDAEVAAQRTRLGEQTTERERAAACAAAKRKSRWLEGASARGRQSGRRRKLDSPSARPASASPSSTDGAKRSPRRLRNRKRCSRSWRPSASRSTGRRSSNRCRRSWSRAVAPSRHWPRRGTVSRLSPPSCAQPTSCGLPPIRSSSRRAAGSRRCDSRNRRPSCPEQQYAEQLAEAHAELAELPERLKAWGRASSLPAEIERLTQAIAGLGAVNLAALDELAQASERKSYLDAQAQDLTEAMTTLESAIRQIDRESRALLQQTFDTVNVNFGKLFPTLFGGGQARLLLTGEEILDSGVQVVAQPPGKRNTTIHLLSGGEKSLTAIALVFALFQLNPAPFCLLDEVDAPLDDPNTDRFCALVRTMADVTQFVFISHNKITMEMANQLIGITMADPGVSRVVAVDIAEALELAETVPQ